MMPLVGNERVLESVATLLSANRFPHAIIIEGNNGTGRKTLAGYIAKAQVCESEASPCSSCRNCHLADALTHPDIVRVAPEDKKKNISVDQIRELRKTAYHTAHTADCRIFVIEQADTMNASAQNSLLKVLEEPPSKVFFILISENAENLLDTVVSRCVVLSVNSPDIETGVKYLESKGYPADSVRLHLEREQGNIGRVLEILEGSEEGDTLDIAHDYLEILLNGSTLDALICTVPLEKSRTETAKFISLLKTAITEKLKSSRDLPLTAKQLVKMHSVLEEYEPLLVTNVNLSLFFTALTAKLNECKK